MQSQIKSKDEELRILRSEICMLQHKNAQRPTNLSSTVQHCDRIKSARTCNVKIGMTPTTQAFSMSELPSARSFSSTSSSSNTNNSDCVQAIVLRAERERDCVRVELERVKAERDALKEKHAYITHRQMEESQNAHQRFEELNERIRQLEKENRELNSARLPSETQIVMLKEEIEALKCRIFELQDDSSKQRTQYNQLK